MSKTPRTDAAENDPEVEHYGNPVVLSEFAKQLEEELNELVQLKERAYDCHSGPGFTTPACGACLTCLHRDLSTAQDRIKKLEEEMDKEIGRAQRAGNNLYLAIVHAMTPFVSGDSRELDWDVLPFSLKKMFTTLKSERDKLQQERDKWIKNWDTMVEESGRYCEWWTTEKTKLASLQKELEEVKREREQASRDVDENYNVILKLREQLVELEKEKAELARRPAPETATLLIKAVEAQCEATAAATAENARLREALIESTAMLEECKKAYSMPIQRIQIGNQIKGKGCSKTT